MDISKVSDTEIEVSKPQPNTTEKFDLRQLKSKKKYLKNMVDVFQAKIAEANSQITEINFLIDECKRLNVTDAEELTPEDI